MAWMGAEVIKVELPGRGDVTRQQLRDLPDVDSLYFTMLNCNKRSITLNTKTESGAKIFRKLIEACDVMVENFAPGALDRQGFTWEVIHEINPRLVYASIKGFGAGPYADFKAYETVAQAMGGAMSTTGFADGPPTSTSAQIGDSGTGIHTLAGILAALLQRQRSGRGQHVEVAMQDTVLNLCRVKLRDQQRLANGPLKEYPTGNNCGEVVPRTGNASGGGQPGAALKCRPGGANDYIYVIIQPPGWAPLMTLAGRPELIEHAEFATPEARLPHLDECFAVIEAWTQAHTKQEVMAALNEHNVPCGPILDMRELLEDPSLAARGTVVEVHHPERGSFKTVGNPIKLSDSPAEVTAPPTLGQHTDEILKGLVGLGEAEIEQARAEGAI
jgi:formyl-CoA transferase